MPHQMNGFDENNLLSFTFKLGRWFNSNKDKVIIINEKIKPILIITGKNLPSGIDHVMKTK